MKNSYETQRAFAQLEARIRAYDSQSEAEIEDKRLMLDAMKQGPILLTREQELAHFTASSWIVNQSHDKVLMVYHKIYDSWSWTGGHADGEADLLAVALREAREETGIDKFRVLTPDIYSLELLEVARHHRRGVYVAPHLHLNLTYLFEADEAAKLEVNRLENSAVRWFSLDEALLRSSEAHMLPIYRKLNERLPRH